MDFILKGLENLLGNLFGGIEKGLGSLFGNLGQPQQRRKRQPRLPGGAKAVGGGKPKAGKMPGDFDLFGSLGSCGPKG